MLVQRALAGGFIAVLMLGSPVWGQQQQQPPERQPGSATITARPISPEAFSGTWDYNDALSVDAATGRPERAPRSATQRATAGGGGAGAGGTGAPRPPAPPSVRPPGSSDPVVGGGAPVAAGGGSGESGAPRNSFDDARRAMAAVIAAERRTYVRDLLEVPELLKIRASTAAVIIGDDLGRERTYEANGRVYKYQLSAARFEARSVWTDTYFRKDIEGANNFRMSETYFLSEDGRRLFVIIRIGDPRKPETLAGVNRVYDRVAGF